MVCMKSGLYSRRFAPCLDCPKDKDTCENIVWTKKGAKCAMVVTTALRDRTLKANFDENGRPWLGHANDEPNSFRLIKLQMISLDGWRCLVCGNRDNLTMDHVVPVIMGGKERHYNIQTLCEECNQLKWSEPCDYRYGGRFIGWRKLWFDDTRAAAVRQFDMARRLKRNEEIGEYHRKNRLRAEEIRRSKQCIQS